MEGLVNINGTDILLSFASDATLLEALRNGGFTEVKEGCGEGQCGACVVILEGRLVNACQVFAATAIGKKILTVKGLGDIHAPHAIQIAFAESGAVQCGFCTPGMVLAAFSLLQENLDPTDEQIRHALDGNLCRCTGYEKIIDAVKLAARKLQLAARKPQANERKADHA